MTGKQKPVFDFRWGVTWMDKSRQGGADVPGFVLRNYNQLGVTLQEMMLIIHLSAYHFNSEQGEAKPSLKTISDMMGYRKDDSVRSLLAKLEEKKLVSVERNPGKCSVYDFSPFAKQCLELDTAGDKSLREAVPHPNGVPHVNGEAVPHPNGDEDQEEKINNKSIAQSPNGAAQPAAKKSKPRKPAKVKTLADLDQLRRVIAINAHHIRPEQGISGRMMVLINMTAQELEQRFGLNGEQVSPDELAAAYKWHVSQDGQPAAPKDAVKTGDMVAKRRAAVGHKLKPAIQVHYPAHPIKGCPDCDGLGQLQDRDTGKTVPCARCLAAEEAADGDAAAA